MTFKGLARKAWISVMCHVDRCNRCEHFWMDFRIYPETRYIEMCGDCENTRKFPCIKCRRFKNKKQMQCRIMERT